MRHKKQFVPDEVKDFDDDDAVDVAVFTVTDAADEEVNELVACCCFCNWRNFARRFLNQTF